MQEAEEDGETQQIMIFIYRHTDRQTYKQTVEGGYINGTLFPPLILRLYTPSIPGIFPRYSCECSVLFLAGLAARLQKKKGKEKASLFSPTKTDIAGRRSVCFP